MQKFVKFKKLIFAILVVIFYLLTRLPYLYSDVLNTDSINWHNRTQAFIKAFENKKYKDTYQSYHPGVTLMWIQYPIQKYFDGRGMTLLERDYALKLELVAINFLLFSFSLFLIHRAFGGKTALVYSLIYLLEPVFIAGSRLNHLDFLLAGLGFNSILCMFYFRRAGNPMFFVFSSLLFALALLTKTTAILFLPLNLLILLTTKSRWYFKPLYIIFFILFTGSLIYLLFPALWVNRNKTLNRIKMGVTDIGVQGVYEIGSKGQSKPLLVKDEEIITPIQGYYVLAFGYMLTPFLILLVVYSSYLLKSHNLQNKPEALILLLFSVGSLIALSIPNKQIDRYLYVIFPTVTLFVSLVLAQNKLLLKLMLIYIIVTSIEVIRFFPYVIAYSNPLFGGLKNRITYTQMPNFGIGSFETAQKIISDYSGDPAEEPYVMGSKSLSLILEDFRVRKTNIGCRNLYLAEYYTQTAFDCPGKYKKVDSITLDGIDFIRISKRAN